MSKDRPKRPPEGPVVVGSTPVQDVGWAVDADLGGWARLCCVGDGLSKLALEAGGAVFGRHNQCSDVFELVPELNRHSVAVAWFGPGDCAEDRIDPFGCGTEERRGQCQFVLDVPQPVGPGW